MRKKREREAREAAARREAERAREAAKEQRLSELKAFMDKQVGNAPLPMAAVTSDGLPWPSMAFRGLRWPSMAFRGPFRGPFCELL